MTPHAATTTAAKRAGRTSPRPSGLRRLLMLGSVLAMVAALSGCDINLFSRGRDLPGWKLLSADDFNGTGLDTSRWQAYHNTYGDGNLELACLTPNNVRVDGGSLKITARRERMRCPNGSERAFTSGFLGSREVGRFLPRFGRFEMRAKLPHGQGLWPGLWLRHRNGAPTAEVDIMEYFHSAAPGRTTSTLHLDGRYNLSKATEGFEAPTPSPGWHRWGVEITPSGPDIKFTFLLDGRSFHSYIDTQHNWASADPNATWDMAVNLSVGGRWTGHPDGALGYLDLVNRCAQGGTPPNGCSTTGIRRADFQSSSTYEVDWIRVYTPA